MRKRYFIYWWVNKEISGNTLINFDLYKSDVNDLKKIIIKENNRHSKNVKIDGLVIKFIMEIK